MVITICVSHRLLIPVASVSPVFMTANVAGAALLLQPLFYCASRTVAGAVLKAGKLKTKQRAELPFDWTRGDGKAETREKERTGRRETRILRDTLVNVDFPRPYLVKSHQTCVVFFFFFTHLPLAQRKSKIYADPLRLMIRWRSSGGDSFHQRLIVRGDR